MSIPFTFWVVTKADKDGVPNIDSCYQLEPYAEKRWKHLVEHHEYPSNVEPVTIDFYPVPKTYDDAEARAGWDYARASIRTVGRGVELHNYAEGQSQISLPQVGQAVSDAWTAWREAQLASGNLEEAGREPPEELTRLFDERSGQLELFPRDLP